MIQGTYTAEQAELLRKRGRVAPATGMGGPGQEPAAPARPPAQRTPMDQFRQQQARGESLESFAAAQGPDWRKRKMPWDLRLLSWTFNRVYRAVRFYPMIRSFLLAHLGGPAGKITRSERLAVCEGCPRRRITERNEFGVCASCGCGTHRLASLTWKSRLAWATCPVGKWAGLGPTRR